MPTRYVRSDTNRIILLITEATYGTLNESLTGGVSSATQRAQPPICNRKDRSGPAMSATFLLGALLAVMILIRQMRWLVVIALLVVVGYFAHSRIDFWSLTRNGRIILSFCARRANSLCPRRSQAKSVRPGASAPLHALLTETSTSEPGADDRTYARTAPWVGNFASVDYPPQAEAMARLDRRANISRDWCLQRAVTCSGVLSAG